MALRLAAGAVATLGLVGTAATAAADDDPQPQDWPTIDRPVSDDSSDPQPGSWPTIVQPQAGDNEDPTPPDWPAPSPD